MLQHRFIPILEDTSKPWLVFTFNVSFQCRNGVFELNAQYGLSQTLRQHGLLQVYTAPKGKALPIPHPRWYVQPRLTSTRDRSRGCKRHNLGTRERHQRAADSGVRARVRASRSRSLQYCPWLTGLRQRWTASRQSSIPLSARSHKAVDNLEVAFE